MATYAELTALERELVEPVCIGPTWLKNDDGTWFLPKYTLGWQVARWCAEFLAGDDGKPWRFTMEQLRFILWWYAVDERGEFIYRTGVLQRLKGWGKDPLAAVLCLVELCGPSRFSHWGEDGKPVGKAHPRAWVQIAAVNQAQTRNTATLFTTLMTDKFRTTYGIVQGEILIRASGGRRLECVTSNYRSLEGGRSTFVVLNETHHWVQGNKGLKMYETIDGNATKMKSRYLAITNAYLPGEDSVAERMRDAYEKALDKQARGEIVADIGFLYDSLEANPKAPVGGKLLPLILERVRGDAVWLDIESISKSILNETIAKSRSQRMYFNQIVSEEEAIYGREQWEAIHDPDAVLLPGDPVTMGFDGGKTDDATALMAVRITDMAVFVLGLWQKPDDDSARNWEVPRIEVDSAVRDAMRTYSVKGFYADVALWESYISEWARDYAEGFEVKSPIGKDGISWDMRSSWQRSTRAHERLVQAIFDGKLKHDGNRDLRRHVFNVRRWTNNWGLWFRKETPDSPKKIDLYAALLLAHECAIDHRTNKKPVKKARTGRGYFL